MERLQAERMKDQQKREIMKEVETDSIVQSLDAELKELVKVCLLHPHTPKHPTPSLYSMKKRLSS